MNQPPTVSKQELEHAHSVLADLERKMIESSRFARTVFFSDIQSNVNDRTIPTFSKGSTMSQAFRMGMDAGVEATLKSIDNCGLMLTDDRERILNVDTSNDEVDIISMESMWSRYVNS